MPSYSFNLSGKRREELDRLVRSLNIQFKDYDLLNQALIHRSFARECYKNSGNNERCEFLGDSVLGLGVTEILYRRFPEKAEGELASMKAFLVSEVFLAQWARSFHLGDYLLLGKGEKSTGGADKPAILADAFEAFVGVYYLDQGFIPVRDFLLPYVDSFLATHPCPNQFQDSKTLLQEMIQKICKCCPSYRLSQEEGPDHEKVFWVEVSLFDQVLATGKGNTKKEAEREAAGIAYGRILDKEFVIHKHICHDCRACQDPKCTLCHSDCDLLG
jgi:ribonuclease-3